MGIDRRKYPERLKKVQFELRKDAWHGHSTETLWVEELSPGKYRVENSPFFAFGVSYEDIISAQEHDGMLEFKSVLIFGGHSTYRLLMSGDANQNTFLQYWLPLEKIGCSYENADLGYIVYTVDVPPKANIHLVYSLLEKGELDGIWGFEEGHCGHTL